MTDNGSTLLRAARVVTPDDIIAPGWVLLDGRSIAGVGEGAGPEGTPATDLGDVTLAPGFIDLHVHGGGGVALDSPAAGDLAGFRSWVAGTGVTSFLATVIGPTIDQAVATLERLGADADDGSGAAMIGFNLEGPFLSPDRRGAIPRSWIVPPDVKTFERLLDASAGRLRLMTIAPDVPGNAGIATVALSHGVILSVGHTNAGYETAAEAFRAGATHVTHLFNGMAPFHHRDPGPFGAAIDAKGVTVEVIADGVHLHPTTVRMIVETIGSDRVALITDATPLAGQGDGSFRLGADAATVEGGRSQLSDGTIAGGVATMDEIARNLVSWGVCDLAGAVRMASTVPAAAIGLGDRKGRIAAGYDADLVALDADVRVASVWVAGANTLLV